MATLHHGLLVDPTNSKQIADALLKILTNPEVWDEMSHNGACPLLNYLPALLLPLIMVCHGRNTSSCGREMMIAAFTSSPAFFDIAQVSQIISGNDKRTCENHCLG